MPTIDVYIITKFLHILGVVAFMGGSLCSFILHLSIPPLQPMPSRLIHHQLIWKIERSAVFYGGWILLIAGLSASVIPDTKLYHSFFVMVGFGAFIGQIGLAWSALRTNRKLRDGIFHQEANYWRYEKRCRQLIVGNLLIGILVIFLMVTKITPSS